MYYQIEGRMNMKTITFDEEGMTIGNKTYPIDEISQLRITNAPLFATYGILTFHSGGKDISVPFSRSAIDKLRRAIHDFEHEQEVRKKAAARTPVQPASDASSPETSSSGQPQARQPEPVRSMDPYEEVKKLKELLDMGIVTEEEFQKKKKELLNL